MLELRTLGTLDLRSDGVPVGSVLAQPRRTALFCYLALARPRGFHPREALLPLFWPEHDSDGAHHALRQALYFLRRSLGAGAIVARGDEALAIDAAVLRCDLWEFERALAEGRPADALAAYRGELLPGFVVSDALGFERWLDDERARVRRGAVDAAWLLATGAERSGDAAGAARWAAQATELAPFDEIGLRRQLDLLDRLGDRSAAMEAFDRFAGALEREYELVPSEETLALIERIRDGPSRGLPRPPESATANTEPASVRPPVVGPADGTAPPSPAPGLRRARWADDRRLPGFAAVSLLVVAAVLATLMLSGERGDSAGSGPAAVGLPSSPSTSEPTSGHLLAYELIQRARDPQLQRTGAGRRERLRLYERAIEADSTFAPAHSGLAHAYMTLNFGQGADMRYRDALVLAELHALEALELDSLEAFAYDALGKARLHSYRFDEAESSLRRALELDPALAVAREHLIQLQIFAGRSREALAEAEVGARQNTLSAPLTAELAHALIVNGDCGEAMRQLSRLEDLDPPVARTFPLIAQCRAIDGSWSSAVATMRSDQHRVPYSDAVLAYFLARRGDREEAERILASLIERHRSGNGNAYPIAVAYAGLEDYTAALEWLDAAIDDRSVRESIMEPMFADLRGRPEFEPLARRLGIKNYR